jgi:thioredoxin-related protein|tara:strand:+ start:795 stop:1163 length:369 start_codon:yes stop_codon:yes gene_type:complete
MKKTSNYKLLALFLLICVIVLVIVYGSIKLKESFTSGNKILQYFSMNGCPHCEKFTVTWKEIEKMLNKNTEHFDETSSKYYELVDKFKIQGFPHIQALVNGNPVEYSGSREADKIIDWFNKL